MATSPPIGEALAFGASDRAACAFGVVNPESDAVRIAEIELGEVAMQMLLADVLINTVDAALQDREVIFGSVAVGIPSDVFILRVNDGSMASKFLSNFPINAALVRS